MSFAVSRRATSSVQRISQAARASSSSATAPTEAAAAAAPVAPRRRREAVDTGNVDLVAPPDPLSNIRPVLYASSRRRRPSNSPYSAAEFPSELSGGGAAQRRAERELAWTMHRERVDMANHRFWASTNANFEAQREARLAALPPASDPPTAEELAAREAVLSQFYRDWQLANRARMDKWVREWWSDVWTGIKMQARVYLGRLGR